MVGITRSKVIYDGFNCSHLPSPFVKPSCFTLLKHAPRKLTNGDGWVFSKGIAGKWVGRTIAEPLVSQEEGPDSSNEAQRQKNMVALGPCGDQHANVCCVMGLGDWKCEKRGQLIVALGACFLFVCICLWDLGNMFFPVAFL